MVDNLQIRESEHSDVAEIESIYPQAFPDEDLLPLVRDLLGDPEICTSLVATVGSQITGHVIYTTCALEGSDARVELLGPLAVAPSWQRRGIGSALMRTGLEHFSEQGADLVLLLGDPAYYGRFGFAQESGVTPPYEQPADWAPAWQSRYLHDMGEPCRGELIVPLPWQKRSYWAP